MGGGLQPGGALSSRRARRRSARPMSEINVTPMVDVMLVLLIIFMVTAPLLTVGVDVESKGTLPKVELPKTEAGPVDQEQAPLSVTVDPQGKIFLQNTEIGFDQLVPKLTAIAKNGYDERIFVRGDRRVNYGVVMRVMGTISAAGFRRIALISDLEEKPQ